MDSSEAVSPIAPAPSPAVQSPARPDLRRWRAAAQRNVRKQWSKLAALRSQWTSLSSTALSHATSLVNSLLSQRYMHTMELGVLTDMPDIRKKARSKFLKQQETNRSKLLSSYKDMVSVVTQMVSASKSMRCYLKGTSGSPFIEFSCFPGDQSDTGDGDGIPVFTFWSIFDFEKLAEELVNMLLSEMKIKRLLVMGICSIGAEDFSQVNVLKWSDQLYAGEFDDLRICNLNSDEFLQELNSRLESHNTHISSLQSSNHQVLQVYLTTWLAEVNVDKFRIDELFAIVGEEMHVSKY